MTRWRAVGSGVLVALGCGIVMLLCYYGSTISLFGVPVVWYAYFLVPWRIIAGVAGGIVAGYLSASGLAWGCWHGLLAGVLGGLSIAIVTWVLQVVSGQAGAPLQTVLLLVGFAVVVTGLPSVIAGGSGGPFTVD